MVAPIGSSAVVATAARHFCVCREVTDFPRHTTCMLHVLLAPHRLCRASATSTICTRSGSSTAQKRWRGVEYTGSAAVGASLALQGLTRTFGKNAGLLGSKRDPMLGSLGVYHRLQARLASSFKLEDLEVLSEVRDLLVQMICVVFKLRCLLLQGNIPGKLEKELWCKRTSLD